MVKDASIAVLFVWYLGHNCNQYNVQVVSMNLLNESIFYLVYQ